MAALRSAGAQDEAERYFKHAETFASEFGLGALTLPEKTSDKTESDARMLAYILRDEQKLAVNLTHKYGPPHGATYVAGAKTMLVLMLYAGERNEMSDNLIQGIEDAVRGADMPLELWQPLFKLMRSSASYSDVKRRVLKMVDEVEASLQK